MQNDHDLRRVERIEDWFDAVVFLTVSNWKTEPRSNRYHYATRFASRLPVYFVQPDQSYEGLYDEPSGYPGITLVHCTWSTGVAPSQESAPSQEQARSGVFEPEASVPPPSAGLPGRIAGPRALRAYLISRGVRRPLIWIYNAHYRGFAEIYSETVKIFHATEDFTIEHEKVKYYDDNYRLAVFETIEMCDMLVAVSPSVERNYIAGSWFRGQSITLQNGCDFQFWKDSRAFDHKPQPQKPSLINRIANRPGYAGDRVALYQGGINSRLDFEMLEALVARMPDWRFWFCGAVDERAEYADVMAPWRRMLRQPNVTYFGQVTPERIAELSREATVGLIPYLQGTIIYISLPLKAYEFAACGLPVVTAPVKALEGRPDIFTIARDADEYEAAIRALGPTRADPAAVERRLAAASAMDYGRRFEELDEAICKTTSRLLAAPKRLNILVLYDEAFSHIKTIQEHLQAFSTHSRHRYFYLPVSDTYFSKIGEITDDQWPKAFDFSRFDAVVWHYGMPASLSDYISPLAGEALRRYDGLKILFIQDEYESTATISDWIEKAQLNLVMTCVPAQSVDYVYPGARQAGVEFLQTLTGFVPEDESLDRYATPLAERSNRIGYRGRVLPYHYGTLGNEKYRIGVEMKRLAEAAGVPVDIEVDDAKRIYGAGWYQFLGSVRATLATESGSNVFDFDGRLKAAAAAAREAGQSFDAFFTSHLQGAEDHVRMNQISPKVFEAIRLRTALICFEGEYSGVIEAETHYIPLKKDFSNAAEVFAKLEDLDYLRTLTDRAYADVIASNRYSYAGFVDRFDRIIEGRLLRNARAEILAAPFASRRRGGDEFDLIEHEDGLDYALNTGVLRQGLRRDDLRRRFSALAEERKNGDRRPGRPPRAALAVQRCGPADVVCYDVWKTQGASVEVLPFSARIVTPAVPWHYAAGVPLDLSSVDFDRSWCWLRVRVRNASGEGRVSIFSQDNNGVAHEGALTPVAEAQTYLCGIDGPIGELLLFRNGEDDGAASLEFIEAEVLVSPR